MKVNKIDHINEAKEFKSSICNSQNTFRSKSLNSIKPRVDSAESAKHLEGILDNLKGYVLISLDDLVEFF